MTSEVIEDEKQFYSKAKTYWKEVPPTVDGMLGGYGHISSIDISSSRKFLQRFLRVGRSGVLSRNRGCGPGGPPCSARGATFHTDHRRVFGYLLASTTQASKAGAGAACRLGPLSQGCQMGAGHCARVSSTSTESHFNRSVLFGLNPSLSCHFCGLLGCGCWLFC